MHSFVEYNPLARWGGGRGEGRGVSYRWGVAGNRQVKSNLYDNKIERQSGL